ncbi:soluble lytic murein transglycosylase [Gammaproteobacteria bacterium]
MIGLAKRVGWIILDSYRTSTQWLVAGLLLGLLVGSEAILAGSTDTLGRESLVRVVNRAATADPEALVELANRFEHGLGIKTNLERSHQVYCQAARLGSVRAQLALARMYLQDSDAKDQEQAAAWLAQAADGGDRIAAAVLDTMAAPKKSAARCDSGPPVRGLQPLPPGNPKDRSAIRIWIYTLAPNYGLDPELVLTIAAIESNFNPKARSSKDARGVMQLMPDTAERFGVHDISDPVENIKGGMAYLRWLMAYFRGDVRLVAAAYNAGEGAVEKYSGVPPYTETQNYVERVSHRYPRLVHPYRPDVTKPSSRIAAVARMENRGG